MYPTSNATLEIAQNEASVERRLHFYSRGKEIPLVTQGVWQVERGFVQISTVCPNGEEAVLGWAGTSNFFGPWLLQSLKGNYPLPHLSLHTSYQALSDVYLKWYAINEIESSLPLAQVVLPSLVKRIQQIEALLAIKGQQRVEDRLQQLLLLLKQEIGQPVAEGTRLSVRITHQNLANAIGTTRVTVTRLLSKLQQQGVISVDRQRHIILKPQLFASIAEW